MTPERWQEVKEIFADVLEQKPAVRATYLKKVCTDASLRQEVELMIAAHEQGGSSFMERPTVGLGTNEALKSGTRLGPYEILARIGAGGMGVVYRARDGRLERDVAIKVLPLGLLTDEGARKRFRKEALALAKLNHPNIAAVYDVGEETGADYLVMECVPGKSLAEETRSGSLPEKEATALGLQIATALEEAHEQGIVHRDLTPANIMVTPKRQAKVLDFGLAKILRPMGEASVAERFTQTQNLAGTLPYMAPEQLQGEPIDARTDIHALGLVLYEMASGRRLFQQNSIPQLTDAILHQPPVTPRAFNARLSPELERIILKCLEKEPDNRYQSAKELGVDLRRLGAPATSTGVVAPGPASKKSHRTRWKVLTGVAVLASAAAVGAYFYFHRAPKLTEKDSIVVADFTNTTGDPVFDGALRQGLTAQLQQTPFLQLVSGDRVTDALRLMEKPTNTPLTQDVAREICQRINATTLIQGSIAALGNQYVLGLQASNCSTGETLDQEQVTADSKERVLAALGTAASELRKKLGESAASLQTYDVPFDQAITTSSLEALQAYTRGTDAMLRGDAPSSIPLLQRAVTIDPNFATGYSLLGVAYRLNGEDFPAAENIAKAYSLKDRASEREQFAISTDYALVTTGDVDEGARIGEQWTKVFPHDATAYLALTNTLYFAGQLEQSRVTAQDYVRLDPTPFGYWFLAWKYLMLGRLNEARTTIQQAEANHVDPAMLGDLDYAMAFVGNDSAAMDRASSGPWPFMARGIPDAARSNTAAYRGQLARSRELMGRANTAASYITSNALNEALFGDFPEARRALSHIDNSAVDPFVKGNMAIAIALLGDIPESQKLAGDLEKQYPQFTYLRFGALPAVQALVAMHRDKPNDAIEALSPVSSRELLPSWIFPYSVPSMLPVYVRGQAYLAAHRGAEAAAQFQMILDNRDFVLNSITGSLAHLGLARAYALRGDTAKAKIAYQEFLALWKDADPDIPILKQAKAEYAKLQ
jgi:eukaryotic-like serine/threonine-protein kinase